MNNATVFSLVLSPGATWFSRNSVNSKITSDTVYDKLRRDWARNFVLLIRTISEACLKQLERSVKKRMKLAALPSAMTCRLDGLYTNEAVRFPTEVKQYLTTKFDLGE